MQKVSDPLVPDDSIAYEGYSSCLYTCDGWACPGSEVLLLCDGTACHGAKCRHCVIAWHLWLEVLPLRAEKQNCVGAMLRLQHLHPYRVEKLWLTQVLERDYFVVGLIGVMSPEPHLRL
jgi:hypothetical protein